MRSGGCTVEQTLTSEAASVVKLSLSLARRRGHAQVTPLHVASTLLTTSSSSSNLLRRACLKSQPYHLHFSSSSSSSSSSSHPHPLQCRALELCFNVALNRLPTTPPPSSSSLIHTNPSLSNALIAALKRAQAHQRRGCIEQQQFHQNQQQPLLAIKVELEQLIISILDDPSVSRVMREAGFSSTTVKTNLEELDTSTHVISSPSSFFFDSHLHKEDLRVLMEVMMRRRKRRSNTVVVGDSVSFAEGVVAEFMGRVERGEVPDELRSSHFIKLQLSYVHLRLMSRTEVDMKVDDLRRRVASLASERGRGGVIIYVGDLRWALDDDQERRDGYFSPIDHLIEKVGNLVSEVKTTSSSSSSCKLWLMATASYHSYMRCQVRHPSLETQWALQAVMVPSGGLKLSLQAPSILDPRVTKITQYPFQMLEPRNFNPKEEEDKFLCCAECTREFDKEALALKRESKDTNSGSSQLPYWLQPYRPDNHNKDHLLELRRKWNKLCQSLHSHKRSMNYVPSPYPSSNPWWPAGLSEIKDRALMKPQSINFSDSSPKHNNIRTTLALGSTGNTIRELQDRLRENIPWQSETIPSIVEALLYSRSSEKGTWLLLQGTDLVGKRRLARVAAACLCGSTDKLVHVDSRSKKGIKQMKETLRKEPKCVVLIEDIDRAVPELTKSIILNELFGKEVDLSHGIFILTTSSSVKLGNLGNHDPNRVLKMRMTSVEMDISSEEAKKFKKQRIGENEKELDLNICAEESDITHEMMDSDDEVHCLPEGLLKSIDVQITMDERGHGAAERLVGRLISVCEGRLWVDRTAVEGLTAAMGWFLEREFESWVKEVFELSFLTVGNGGKVRLGMEGVDGNVGEGGFMGSVLPKRIHME